MLEKKAQKFSDGKNYTMQSKLLVFQFQRQVQNSSDFQGVVGGGAGIRQRRVSRPQDLGRWPPLHESLTLLTPPLYFLRRLLTANAARRALPNKDNITTSTCSFPFAPENTLI